MFYMTKTCIEQFFLYRLFIIVIDFFLNVKFSYGQAKIAAITKSFTLNAPILLINCTEKYGLVLGVTMGRVLVLIQVRLALPSHERRAICFLPLFPSPSARAALVPSLPRKKAPQNGCYYSKASRRVADCALSNVRMREFTQT